MTKLKFFASITFFVLLSPTAFADDRELFNRALALSKQGQWQQAADIYTQIASRNPQWPEPKNNLAVSLINLGKVSEAQQALDAAVVSRSSFNVAQTNRQRLYDYLAAQAYSKALSQKSIATPPALDLINAVDLPVAAAAVPAQAATVVQTALPAVVNSKTTGNDTVITIEAFVNNWAQSWSAGAVKNYLTAYSSRFTPDDGKNFEQWSDSRRVRLQVASHTKVDVQELRIYLDMSQRQAVAEFIQSYTSSTYSDRTVKQLVLTLEGANWRILAERVITQM